MKFLNEQQLTLFYNLAPDIDKKIFDRSEPSFLKSITRREFQPQA